MKFGVCYDVEMALEKFSPNADYIEVRGATICELEASAYGRVLEGIRDGRLKTYSCNALIDPSLRLTGEEVSFPAIEEYCDKLFYRLAEMGVTMLVFGSGKAKRVPDGFSRERAWDQLFRLGELLSDKAKPFGQTVAVEPLRYDEVNIVNTVDEGAYYVNCVGRDNFKLLVDFFHFDCNGEDFESLRRHKDLLVHAHFATPVVRNIPHTPEEWDFYRRCRDVLQEIGYRGSLSYEGRGKDLCDIDGMLAQMKALELK
jgi:sugar phosphate isomerase/epimerase